MKTCVKSGMAAVVLGVGLMVAGAHGSRSLAADLPVYVPPPPPLPVWSWTGPYAGLHVGTVDGDVTARGGEQDPQEFELDPNGIIGGVQAGYNFQFDSIVLGIEGDIGFGDIDDVAYPDIGRIEVQVEWMATIRARVGWAWDRTLFYATGGAAFADMQLEAPELGSDTQTMFGWTVGGGVEHALTDYLSFKAEYLYADFGKETFFEGPEEGRADLKTHTFRVGVNWLF